MNVSTNEKDTGGQREFWELEKNAPYYKGSGTGAIK
jgi:hypothetical protein